MTEEKFIECIIVHISENKLIVEMYDESLNHLESIILDSLELQGESMRLAKCIHLKNEIGAFTYYPFNNRSALYVQIKKLVFCDSHYTFENVIENENRFQITIKDNVVDHSFSSITMESLIK